MKSLYCSRLVLAMVLSGIVFLSGVVTQTTVCACTRKIVMFNEGTTDPEIMQFKEQWAIEGVTALYDLDYLNGLVVCSYIGLCGVPK